METEKLLPRSYEPPIGLYTKEIYPQPTFISTSLKSIPIL